MSGRRPVGRWLACLAVLASAGCGGTAIDADDPREPGGRQVWKLSGPTMGTRYAVSIVGGRERDASDLRGQIDERLAAVNRRMSTYDPESELSRFNASGSTDWFEVSAETASVVRSALRLARESGGAYDPTVGPLVNLWGFGPGKRREAPPTVAEIAAAKMAVGSDRVEARVDPPALRKSSPGVYVDLSSIAKGHGVDAVAGLLEDAGVSAYLVEIGGEVRARGVKPNGRPWRIGVEKPDESPPVAGRAPQRIVELRDRSLATSGDYRNFFEHGGRRYSHTIDPTTGRPVKHGLATVTVLADACRDADGLATALLVLGPDAGYDWAVERGVAALFVSRTDADELVERTTPAWDQQNAANTEAEP